MTAMYAGLAAVGAVGVSGCLAAMFALARSPARSRTDTDA